MYLFLIVKYFKNILFFNFKMSHPLNQELSRYGQFLFIRQ